MLEAAAQYREALYRFVVGRVKDRAAAEDIVHDVLIRAYEKQSQLRDETRLAPWLYQMTRNAITDHHRAQRPFEELPEELVAPEAEREALQQLAQCLTPLIEQLPEHYRTALELSELQGLTQQETAGKLGISLSGAKSRVQRARTKLEELVHQCCRIELDHRGAVVDYEPRHRCTESCNGACTH
jgi:RNA polymerase sigma-70 factor, ECF subfamily